MIEKNVDMLIFFLGPTCSWGISIQRLCYNYEYSRGVSIIARFWKYFRDRRERCRDRSWGSTNEVHKELLECCFLIICNAYSVSQALPCNIIRALIFNLILNYSCTVPAIFRPSPADLSMSYSPYVSPTTADLISTFTIPSIKAILTELLTVGKTTCTSTISYNFT